MDGLQPGIVRLRVTRVFYSQPLRYTYIQFPTPPGLFHRLKTNTTGHAGGWVEAFMSQKENTLTVVFFTEHYKDRGLHQSKIWLLR